MIFEHYTSLISITFDRTTQKKNALILLAVVMDTLNEDKFLNWNNYLPDFRYVRYVLFEYLINAIKYFLLENSKLQFPRSYNAG